ncbi:uncharacterized protein FIBRA_06381 [Fibroporia radiculosa]|uniref:Uncharacterized protein n=1 Tax=Fibroporia radiculosa TaxID=599839 RepID=J4H417_9APHY|nr:uncharacterized protein FIBRA_06381 [Fibroporia radiculosa]CCM04214.1 predicted protein [Fibroporia radiculosa]
MIAGPSSPLPNDPESPVAFRRRGHTRTASVPHTNYPRTAAPRLETQFQPLDRPMRKPTGPRTTAPTQNLPTTPQSSIYPSRRGDFQSEMRRSRPFDSDSDSLISLREDEQTPFTPTSFLSLHASPTDSTVSLRSVKRERRASIQTVPLPPKKSNANKRRSVMSAAELYFSDVHDRDDDSPSMLPRTFDDEGWRDEAVPELDWRQADSPFQDDRSFLITS